MVSSTLCPAVHILGSQNVYGRAEGIADHYWPWAVFSTLQWARPWQLCLCSCFSSCSCFGPPNRPSVVYEGPTLAHFEQKCQFGLEKTGVRFWDFWGFFSLFKQIWTILLSRKKGSWGLLGGSGKASVSERGGMALLEQKQRVVGAQKVRNGQNNG